MPASISRFEFIALMAMLFATIAFSVDSMMPALPEIGRELSPENLNNAQLILTSFVLGMGIGTLFMGPLSDTLGRKPVVIGGVLVYIIGAIGAYFANSMEMMIAARILQGLGASGPRIVSLAVVRDLFSGASMARIMSFVFMIFSVVPAIAPSLGDVIINASGWRSIFVVCVLFSVIACFWFGIRLPETLPKESRRPFSFSKIWEATREVFANRMVVLSIAVQTVSYVFIFAIISSIQPIFDVVFDMADTFPLWFGAVAIISSSASVLNAALVMRLGMRRIVTTTFVVECAISTIMLMMAVFGFGGPVFFAFFLIWKTSIFFTAGMTIGNLNALAMEPLGHIAGTAASVIGAVSTVISVAIAVPIGLMFNGTIIPITLSFAVLSAIAIVAMQMMHKNP